MQFPLQERPCQTEVVICPSSTSVASDSGLTLRPGPKAKPHPQPRRHHNTEAETSVPQPPSVHKRSVSWALYARAAALFTRPFNNHFLHLSTCAHSCGSHQLFIIEAVIIIVKPPRSNNFFADFGLFAPDSSGSPATLTGSGKPHSPDNNELLSADNVLHARKATRAPATESPERKSFDYPHDATTTACRARPY